MDIPIGLTKEEYDWRKCDLEARERLGFRWQSVFLTPPRCVVTEARKAKESASTPAQFQKALARVNERRREKMGFSVQSWNITPMIVEVDDFLQKRKKEQTAGPTIREVHPEILFWALNGEQVMRCGKKTLQGFYERMNVLRKVERRADAILEHALPLTCDPKIAGGDDILDALAAAVTARLGHPRKLATLPAKPEPDDCGLPMEMVYYNPHDA